MSAAVDRILAAEEHGVVLRQHHGTPCRCAFCRAAVRAIARSRLLHRYESSWFKLSRRQQRSLVRRLAAEIFEMDRSIDEMLRGGGR